MTLLDIKLKLEELNSIAKEIHKIEAAAEALAEGNGKVNLAMTFTNTIKPEPTDKPNSSNDYTDALDATIYALWTQFPPPDARFRGIGFGFDPACPGREQKFEAKSSTNSFSSKVSDVIALEVLGHIIREKREEAKAIIKQLEAIGLKPELINSLMTNA